MLNRWLPQFVIVYDRERHGYMTGTPPGLLGCYAFHGAPAPRCQEPLTFDCECEKSLSAVHWSDLILTPLGNWSAGGQDSWCSVTAPFPPVPFSCGLLQGHPLISGSHLSHLSAQESANFRSNYPSSGPLWGTWQGDTSKQWAFTRGWFYVGPASQTLTQHRTSLGWTLPVFGICMKTFYQFK